MDITITLRVTVEPGTLKTQDEIKAELSQRLEVAAYQAAADYGPAVYTVSAVEVVKAG